MSLQGHSFRSKGGDGRTLLSKSDLIGREYRLLLGPGEPEKARLWLARASQTVSYCDDFLRAPLYVGEDLSALKLSGLDQRVPYVLSLAHKGERTLLSLLNTLSWQEFSQILLKALTGIAHGHYRGIIDGWLSAERIFLSPDAEGGYNAGIYDFGLFFGQSSRENQALEAPEARQLDAHPGLDVFSLGVLTFRWLYGRYPTPGEQTTDRREQNHFVPSGLSDWLAKALHPDQDQRFRCAASARVSLASVLDPSTVMRLRLRALAELQSSGIDCSSWWRNPDLYRDRTFPAIGRIEERKALWSHYLQALELSQPRALLFVSSTGMGKTRLSDWLAEGAYQTSCAVRLVTSHSELDPPQIITTDPMSGPHSFGALEAQLQASLALHSGPRQWTSTQEVISKLAQSRPVIIEIENAHLARPTLDWVESILTADLEVPIFFLIHVTEEELSDRPVESVQLSQLLELGCVEELRLKPLDYNETVDLLHLMAPLEPELAFELANHLGGSPLWAVQLITDWVERQVLVPREDRREVLTIPSSIREEIPHCSTSVWIDRLQRVVTEIQEQSPEEANYALAVAAILGMETVLEEWREVLALLDRSFPETLIQALLATRLLRDVDHGRGIRFAHGLFRESLLAWAGEEKIVEEIHQACAELLSKKEENHYRWHERLGLHLLGAGDLEVALEHLIKASGALGNRGRHREAIALLRSHQHACDQLELSSSDSRRLMGMLRQSWCLHNLGLAEQSRALVIQVREELGEENLLQILGPLLWLESHFAFALGDLTTVKEKLDQAHTHFTARQDTRGLASTQLRLGSLHRELLEPEPALAAFTEAQKLFESLADYLGAQAAWEGRVSILQMQGDYVGARVLLLARASEIRELGPKPRAVYYDLLAKNHQGFEQWDQAEAAFKTALETWKDANESGAMLTRANLAYSYLCQERYSEALELLEPLIEEYGKWGYLREQMYVLAGTLPSLASQGMWRKWKERAGILEAYLLGNQIRTDSYFFVFQLSAAMALEQGLPDHAGQADRVLAIKGKFLTQGPGEAHQGSPEEISTNPG